MPTYRLTQRCEVYEHCYIEARSANDALQMYQSEEFADQDVEWKHDEYGDTCLIGVDEVTEAGANICYEVCDGELIDVNGTQEGLKP